MCSPCLSMNSDYDKWADIQSVLPFDCSSSYLGYRLGFNILTICTIKIIIWIIEVRDLWASASPKYFVYDRLTIMKKFERNQKYRQEQFVNNAGATLHFMKSSATAPNRYCDPSCFWRGEGEGNSSFGKKSFHETHSIKQWYIIGEPPNCLPVPYIFHGKPTWTVQLRRSGTENWPYRPRNRRNLSVNCNCELN